MYNIILARLSVVIYFSFASNGHFRTLTIDASQCPLTVRVLALFTCRNWKCYSDNKNTQLCVF